MASSIQKLLQKRADVIDNKGIFSADPVTVYKSNPLDYRPIPRHYEVSRTRWACQNGR